MRIRLANGPAQPGSLLIGEACGQHQQPADAALAALLRR